MNIREAVILVLVISALALGIAKANTRTSGVITLVGTVPETAKVNTVENITTIQTNTATTISIINNENGTVSIEIKAQ